MSQIFSTKVILTSCAVSALIVICVLFIYPRNPFNIKSTFNFIYFSNIKAESQFETQISLPIFDQLHGRSHPEDTETYLVIDPQIAKKIASTTISVNGHSVSEESILDPKCDIYPFTCLISIPNDYIDSDTVQVTTNTDLYALNKNKDIFIGLLFMFNRKR